MKKGLILLMFGAVALSFGISSCDKIDSLDDYKTVTVGQTATMPLNGDYFIRLESGTVSGSDTTWAFTGWAGSDYYKVSFYNTATNTKDTIWMNDPNLWPVQAKINCNPAAKAFIPGIYDNPGDTYSGGGWTIEVKSGKVILNGAITAAGNKSDSLCVVVEFSDDPGTLYRYSGYRRTGFQEDEH